MSGDKRRHPAEVTADRLRDALAKWPGCFDGPERDAVSRLIWRLESIADLAQGRRP